MMNLIPSNSAVIFLCCLNLLETVGRDVLGAEENGAKSGTSGSRSLLPPPGEKSILTAHSPALALTLRGLWVGYTLFLFLYLWPAYRTTANAAIAPAHQELFHIHPLGEQEYLSVEDFAD